MKLSNIVLLAAVLITGASFAAAQDRDNSRWDNRGYMQTVQYRNNNSDYQRGVQDGINSGRADANGNRRFNLGAHPYYTNSNNQAYREGFSQGYREAYGQGSGRYNSGAYNNGSYNNGRYNNNGYYDNNGHWHERDRDHDGDHDWDRDHDRDRDHDHDRDDQPHS